MGTERENIQQKARGRRKQPLHTRTVDRVSSQENRDLLTVLGKDKKYSYRWVHDESETGQRIWKLAMAGYSFVSPEEVKIPKNMVFDSTNYGSLIRRPAGTTVGGKTYLYLMKIPREYYDESRKKIQDDIDAQEQEMLRPRNAYTDDGQYGNIRIEHGTKRGRY